MTEDLNQQHSPKWDAILDILAGDANLDGKVDFADLLILSQHQGKAASAGWDQGDFNYDGKVDFADLLALAQNYQH